MNVNPLLIGILALMASAPLTAQVRPQPGPGDPRIQSVDYRADQVVLIEAAPGYQVTIELAPDEGVESVAVGDSGSWQVTANHAGNRLFVKPLQPGVGTNMTVISKERLYVFDLSSLSGPDPSAPYTVRFRYAPPVAEVTQSPQAPAAAQAQYTISGVRALRPLSVQDDGTHTYIAWPADAGLPATYVVDERGRETLANGNMRAGIYVLDSVAEHLRFRIDKQVARADRRPLRKSSS